MLGEKDRSGNHELFERSRFFRRYWFIESAVILVVWIVMILVFWNDKTTWAGSLSWLTMYAWTLKGLGKWVSIFLGVVHFAFVLTAIGMNIYKRVRVCNSLSCYLGETENEKFKKERKVLNMATVISSFGIISAVPLIYFLSFLFRIIFLRFIRSEEKNSNRATAAN